MQVIEASSHPVGLVCLTSCRRHLMLQVQASTGYLAPTCKHVARIVKPPVIFMYAAPKPAPL